jgi:hypothetical protein
MGNISIYVLTVTILMLLPIVLSIIQLSGFNKILINYYNNRNLPYHYINDINTLNNNITIIFPFYFNINNNDHKTFYLPILELVFVPALIFALYPLRYRHAEKYFLKKGWKKAILEYQCIKKIVCIEIIICIIMFMLYGLSYEEHFHLYLIWYNSEHNNNMNFLLFPYLLINHIGREFIYSIFLGVLWIIFQSRKADFYFYLSKGYIDLSLTSENNIDKTKFLFKSINTYSKYIIRLLNLEIKDIRKIYSTLLTDIDLDIDEVINSISLSFNNNNKLLPLKTIPYCLKIKETSEFLTKETFINRLEDKGVFLLIGLIPIINGILQIVFRNPVK